MSYDRITLRDAAERLAAAENILVIGHTNADADAIGSTCALCLAMKGFGKKAVCAYPDIPDKRLAFLLADGSYFGPDNLNVSEYDLICSVDVASPSQLGCFSDFSDRIDFMIDHHGMGETFAPNYVDGKAAACGEIVFRLLTELEDVFGRKAENKPDIMRRLYSAIVADCGSFKYSNTTKNTLLIAAEITDIIDNANDGGDTHDRICFRLTEEKSEEETALMALCVSKMKKYNSGKVRIVTLEKKEYEELGLTENELGGAIEVPRNVTGTSVAAVIRETAAGYKASVRSNDDTDVSEICRTFGGGGHKKAAGCRIQADTAEEAGEKLLRAIEDNM